ncbi:MAG TPA: hypothetical protein VN279_15940, partial [Rhodocyclaceae bacterium]|nr:hypothetical protein [Rhodocyclaceae bacterium]
MVKSEIDASTEAPKRRFRFPGAVATLATVTVLVWLAALFIAPGIYRTDAEGSPIPGTYTRIESPLTPAERVQQLILAPVNGVYGLRSPMPSPRDTPASLAATPIENGFTV